jgi:predicted DNA-binding protein
MKNDKYYAFYVNSDLYDKFHELSKRENRTAAAQLRTLIQQWIKEKGQSDENKTKFH